MLPNLIIPGFPKCGTTTLHKWLADHPQVHGASLKEVEFFNDRDWHGQNEQANAHNSTLADYEHYFEGWQGQGLPSLVLESTPAYVYQHTALTQIPDLPSKPQMVFLVRKPSSQIKSVYDYLKNTWQHIPTDWSFARYVEALEQGDKDFSHNELAVNALDYANYPKWLDLWRDRVGADRMIVYTLEEFFADPANNMAELAQRFGIDAGFYASYDFPRENESYQVKSHTLQAVNVRIRELLPKDSALYEAAKSIYRRINTGGKSSLSAQADIDALHRLDDYFADHAATLAQSYQLDLSRWR